MLGFEGRSGNKGRLTMEVIGVGRHHSSGRWRTTCVEGLGWERQIDIPIRLVSVLVGRRGGLDGREPPRMEVEGGVGVPCG